MLSLIQEKKKMIELQMIIGSWVEKAFQENYEYGLNFSDSQAYDETVLMDFHFKI